MKIKKGISLPYPVLGLGDDVNGSFKIDIKASVLNQELLLVEESIEINNVYFNSLLLESKIASAYKIICPSTLYLTSHLNGLDLKIPCSDLSHTVTIECFLVTLVDLPNYTDESFNPDSKLGENNGVFFVKKGSIVGDAGTLKIELDPIFTNGVAGIIEFKPVSIDEPISIDTDNPKIIISYPKREGDLDIVNILSQKNSRFPKTFLNLFILPALTNAFQVLIDATKEDKYDELVERYVWASVIDSLSDDIDSSDDSFQLAQLFLKSIIETKQNIVEPIPVVSAFNELKEI
jgi:hypothetical protein